MQNRIGSCKRKTKETDIELTINLDGQGKNQIDTGIPFFDHMLDGFARHGLFDLNAGNFKIKPSYDYMALANKTDGEVILFVVQFYLPDKG